MFVHGCLGFIFYIGAIHGFCQLTHSVLYLSHLDGADVWKHNFTAHGVLFEFCTPVTSFVRVLTDFIFQNDIKISVFGSVLIIRSPGVCIALYTQQNGHAMIVCDEYVYEEHCSSSGGKISNFSVMICRTATGFFPSFFFAFQTFSQNEMLSCACVFKNAVIWGEIKRDRWSRSMKEREMERDESEWVNAGAVILLILVGKFCVWTESDEAGHKPPGWISEIKVPRSLHSHHIP